MTEHDFYYLLMLTKQAQWRIDRERAKRDATPNMAVAWEYLRSLGY